MIATEFVQPPQKEEPVDPLQSLSYCDAADHSFADSDASTSPSLSSSDHDDFSDLCRIEDSSHSSNLRSNDRRIVFCGKLIPHRESPPNPPPPTIPENKRSPFQIDRGRQKEHEQEGLIADDPEREGLVVPDGVRIGEIPATEMALS